MRSHRDNQNYRTIAFRRLPAIAGSLLLFVAVYCGGAQADSSLARDFAQPPVSVRPWTWAHWLNGNVTRESITRDLESIQRVGLGGVTMFDVAQTGIPPGPNEYFDSHWQSLFDWEISEAKRLGLEVMSQNGAGYSGNGGPWITPELASQTIVESETRVTGGECFSGKLPQPETRGGFYRDVAVLAICETEAQANYRIEGLNLKRLVWTNYIKWAGTCSAPLDAAAPGEVCIAATNILNLTSQLKADGSLTWEVPPGDWTILRFGHTWTGQNTLPAPPAGMGPECNKLDKRGIQAHFDHLMQRMVELAGPEAGKTFHTFFADSWEAGGQNWTERMPQEFKRRRGYDIIPWLPVMTGRVVVDLQTSERFLYDLRQTASELMVENFWAELQRLCHAKGMRLAVQPYITTGNDLDAANYVDEPMGECWAIPNGPITDYRQTIKAAVSVADLNGRTIVGVEAFTSTAAERWQSYPATLKALGDQMFCLGANRFQFHRFAMQRFPLLKPGMMMGGWGQQYDRTQTWWEWSKPWHDYLARCQLMLRQGPVVADVLAVVPEEPLYRFEHKPMTGYDYDGCGPDVFKKVAIRNGKITTANGRQYQLITVAHNGTMTLERLKHLRDLVRKGAAILGEPPQATPGLENLPTADVELRKLAAELWGDAGETDRVHGKGRVFRGMTPEAALAKLGVIPDFAGPAYLTWIHRASDNADVYFIASASSNSLTARCTFRMRGRPAELWDAEKGSIRPLDTFPTADGRLTAEVPLGPSGSAFVVFRGDKPELPTVVAVCRDGNTLFPESPSAAGGKAGESEVEWTVARGGKRGMLLHQAGDYSVEMADGKIMKFAGIQPGGTRTLVGPWSLKFPADSGVSQPLTLSSLVSWSELPQSDARHFSGTANYRTQFVLPEKRSEIFLDLGRVEVMPRVRLNGRDLGILWKPPYRVDVTDAARAGTNTLEIAVVNLWVNRLIGDAALPEDAERDKSGRLVAWPDWVIEGKPSPTGRRSFVTFPLWRKDEPLKESGLLGPVTLRFPVAVSLELTPAEAEREASDRRAKSPLAAQID